MGEDVAADRLSTVSPREESTGSWVTLDLIGQEHGNIEL
jgi:hypothetical protein